MRKNGIDRDGDQRILGRGDLLDDANAVDDYVWPNLAQKARERVDILDFNARRNLASETWLEESGRNARARRAINIAGMPCREEAEGRISEHAGNAQDCKLQRLHPFLVALRDLNRQLERHQRPGPPPLSSTVEDENV
jgi:hypothetical protein